MQNLIDATKATGARLIFFDNVYMYGHVTSPMTEGTPYNPSSVKGEIRARIAEKLMHEVQAGSPIHMALVFWAYFANTIES